MRSILSFFSVSFVSGLATLLLTGCPAHQNSQSNRVSVQAQAVTAQLYAPSTLQGSSTTTIKVALTSATGATSGSYRTEIVDVGNSSPKINCGNAQYLVPGGAEGSFSCEIPAASLGAGSEHQLQVMVNGAAVKSAPESIEVVEPGLVKDELVSAASGDAVTRAAPGQSLKVTFDMGSALQGAGKYTVKAPAGWLQGGNATCSLPSDVNGATCSIAITVPTSANFGKQYLHLSAESGSTPLQNTYFGLDIVPAAVTSTPSPVTMLYAENISATLYGTPLHKPAGAMTFTYRPVVVFENTSSNSVNISAQVANIASTRYGCGIALDPYKNPNGGQSGSSCTLPGIASGKTPCPQSCYYVTGRLDNLLGKNGEATSEIVAVKVKDGSGVIAQYSQPVTFVKYYSGHVAIRIINVPGNNQVHVAASYSPKDGGPYMVDFSGIQGEPVGVGVVKSKSVAAWKSDQYPLYGKTGGNILGKDGGVIYMPYGNSGALLITRGEGFVHNAKPSPTDGYSPPFLLFEPSYYQQVPKTTCSIERLANTCEELFTDLSYVDSIAIFARIAGIGQGVDPRTGLPPARGAPQLWTQSLAFGKIDLSSSANDFENIKSSLDKLGVPWTYDSTRWAKFVPGQANFLQEDPPNTGTGKILQLLAPITVAPIGAYAPPSTVPGPINPFSDINAETYYKTYIDALWGWLEKGHELNVLDEQDSRNLADNEECILAGSYKSSGPYKGKLVFIEKVPSNCKKNPVDSPPIVMDEFKGCDFVLAAGSSECNGTAQNPHGLWGATKSLRSFIGTALASYQTIGKLPQCSDPGKVMSSANASQYVHNVRKYKTFTNPTCLNLKPPKPYTAYPVYNPYADLVGQYVNVYTYTFSDYLQISGAIAWYEWDLSREQKAALPRAQPVTITLY